MDAKKQSKRGRKSKEIKFEDKEPLESGSYTFSTDSQETFILHLPISIDKIMDTFKISSIQFLPGYDLRQINISRVESQKKENIKHTPVSPETNIDFKNYKAPVSNNYTIANTDCVINETLYDGNKRVDVTVTTINCLPKEINTSNNVLLESTFTDISCWWCCHPFDNYPMYMPIKYDSLRAVYKVKGIFCSFNCSYSYGFNHKPSVNVSLLKTLRNELRSLYGVNPDKKCFHNYDRKILKKAPPKEILKKFGGTVSIQEYRDGFETIDFKINSYPMVYIPHQIEERKASKMIKDSIDVISDNKEDKVYKSTPVKKQPIIKAKKVSSKMSLSHFITKT
jgi:hypothetical protein